MATRKDFVGAIISGDVKKVKEILKTSKSSKVNAKFSGVLITLAIKQKQPEIARLLINNSASSKKKVNYSLTTPLLYAAQSGNFEAVKNLVSLGANVNGQAKSGCTALHFAAFYDHVNIVRYLLRHGALTNIEGRGKCNPEFTPLHYACSFGKIKSARLLVKHNSEVVNPKNNDAIHPIHLSILFGTPTVTAFLINYVDNINVRFSINIFKIRSDLFPEILESPNQGPTLLHWAVAAQDELTTKLLINNGATVNLKTSISGTTPLMLAAQGSNLKILSLILNQKPNVNDVDLSGNSALHYIYNYVDEDHRSRCAYFYYLDRLNDKERIELLCNAGADVNAKCSFELLPNLTSVFDVAIYLGSHRAVRYLLYKTSVGFKQLDYSTIELAAFDENAVDSRRDDAQLIGVLKDSILGIQCTLAGFIINRHEIGLSATEDTLRRVNALILKIEGENWYDGFYSKQKKIMLKSAEFLKSENIGLSEISYWDFIIGDREDVAKLLFNEDLQLQSQEKIRKVCSDDRFFHYFELFRHKMLYAVEKSNVLKKSIEIINDLFGTELPYDCCEHIVYSMTNSELKSLVDKF